MNNTDNFVLESLRQIAASAEAIGGIAEGEYDELAGDVNGLKDAVQDLLRHVESDSPSARTTSLPAVSSTDWLEDMRELTAAASLMRLRAMDHAPQLMLFSEWERLSAAMRAAESRMSSNARICCGEDEKQ